MNQRATLFVLLFMLQLFLTSSLLAETDESSVTLSIPNMSCISCEIRVGQALRAVEGVGDVHFDMDAKTVTVRFDERTDIEALKSATAEVGYPATVVTESG
jgi:periplasmic mercuric ion binding protein